MSSEYDTCESTVELAMLAPGMAKQYERYEDALQELIDNAVSATVDSEAYFDNPDEPVRLAISITRTEEAVRTRVADAGPGIDHETLTSEIFRTGNKSASSGILNNVGWGLKASLAWFERTLAESTKVGVASDTAFELRTQQNGGSHEWVHGPVTGDLPVTVVPEDWSLDDDHNALDFGEIDHGTCVTVSCARDRFDDDVWASAESLETKIQYLRERLGVLFRRLLDAHDDTKIELRYHDTKADVHGRATVIPIFPIYAADASEEESAESIEHTKKSFTVGGEDTQTFSIEYEAGTLDYDAMTDSAAEHSPELLTASNRFRYRYRPSQNRQGIDVYANGRILMTSVFSELFDLTRNNQYNYFGGTLRIRPLSSDDEVPTDNNKTRIDANSALWQKLRQKLTTPKFQPQGRKYGYRGKGFSGTNQESPKEKQDSLISAKSAVPSSIKIDDKSDIFDLHHADTRKLRKEIETIEADTGSSLTGNIELVITSPPYFDIKDYGYEDGMQIGRGDSYEKYLNELREVFKTAYDLTSDTASLWIVVNTIRQRKRVFDLPSDISHICQTLNHKVTCPRCGRDGFDSRGTVEPVRRDPIKCPNCKCIFHPRPESWHLEDVVIWNKTRARPFSNKGTLRNVFEYIICLSKGGDFNLDTDAIRVADPSNFKPWWVDYPERYHPRGKLPDNIWEIAPPAQGAFASNSPIHPAPFPPELVERICKMATDPGDIVLDPFAGSGTVVAQANAMNRRGLGFELSFEFYNSYPDTVNSIEKRMVNSTETTASATDLTHLLTALRQVKLSTELLRTVANRRGLDSPSQLDVHTVFHVSTQLGYQCVNERTHGSGELYLITDEISQRERRALETDIREALSTEPCNRYGIDISPSVHTTEEIVQRYRNDVQIDIGDCRFLYTDGRHYAFNERITFIEWQSRVTTQSEWGVNLGAAADPPVISNLGCDTNHPKHTLETMDRNTTRDHEIQMVHQGKEQTIAQIPDTR